MALLLELKKTDTDRVINMWMTATYLYSYAPDSSIRIAQRALQLAERIKYTEGISRSLGKIANGFLSLGNYPQALTFYLKKLKIEESANKPYNLASVTMNIGIVYVYREEYDKALVYLKLADSIINANKFIDLQWNINLNLGDVYIKKNNIDSSFFYFNKSYVGAKQLKDGGLIGTALTGMAEVYSKAGDFKNALSTFKDAIQFLKDSQNEDFLCEAALGIAKLYKTIKISDSAIYYAKYSFLLAKKDGFQSRELDAATFLNNTYLEIMKMDSAYVYLQQVQVLGDSLNSKKSIRASEILSINEEFRQADMIAKNLQLKEDRQKQLQLLLIGLCIPLFFLMTLLLSKVRVHARVIRFLGIISLLILFEYTTLLLHPRVEAFTHHTPFYEMLIFVTIASLLIPAHHRIERWLLEKLTIKKGTDIIKIKTTRIKVKNTI
jgi:tetratricopeptide (TPR) repeat protein